MSHQSVVHLRPTGCQKLSNLIKCCSVLFYRFSAYRGFIRTLAVDGILFGVSQFRLFDSWIVCKMTTVPFWVLEYIVHRLFRYFIEKNKRCRACDASLFNEALFSYLLLLSPYIEYSINMSVACFDSTTTETFWSPIPPATMYAVACSPFPSWKSKQKKLE